MTRRSPWTASPDVDLGPRYDTTQAERAAWAAKLARVLLARPEGVNLFFRAAFAGVEACVFEDADGNETGADLDAKAILSVKLYNAEIGDP